MNTFNRGRPEPGNRRDYSPQTSKPVEAAYYRDPQKTLLNPDLLDKYAEEQAGLLHTKINSAQIRRFFGEIKNLYLRLTQGRTWSELEPMFRMIKSKVAYAQGTDRVTQEFGDFLIFNINKVKDQKDFEAFVMFFEAVLGFAYGKGMVKK